MSLYQVNTSSVLTLLSSPNAVSLELGERLLLKQRLYVELAALYYPACSQDNSIIRFTPRSYGSHGQHRRALELLGEHGRNVAELPSEPPGLGGPHSLRGPHSTIQYLRRLSSQHESLILEFR
jgi:hypothetical protein